jgi:GNAT superfamily N-acetyltransferase
MSPRIVVREAQPADRTAILGMVPRLRAFGSVPLRAASALDAGEQRTVNTFFDSPREGSVLYVAEQTAGVVAGAAYAERMKDYFTEEIHGHLGILMVARSAEGHGVGRALVIAIEQWALAGGFRFLTLNVFAGNQHAREFYERAAYKPDIVRYFKPLG